MSASGAPPRSTRARSGHRACRWWRIARRVLAFAFFALVGVLLVSQARAVDWSKVGAALFDYPLHTLLAAGAVAAASHAVYSGFDLLGRRWTGHGLPTRRVVPVTFVSYAFNLNLGSLIGGVAFRYRLYSRLGLDNDTITRVLGLSLATNWLGYLALAGGVFAWGVIAPPADWQLGAGALRALGALLLALAAAYILMCGFSPRRSWTVRGHELTLPPLGLALAQLAISCVNWLLIAGVLYLLLQRQVGYATVLAVLLIAAVAGVLAHIPAGLGVLEAVFIALLEGQQSRGQLLAALLAYRALYYLAPLVLAIGIYLVLEARAGKTDAAPTNAGQGGSRSSANASGARPTAAARCPSAARPEAGEGG